MELVQPELHRWLVLQGLDNLSFVKNSPCAAELPKVVGKQLAKLFGGMADARFCHGLFEFTKMLTEGRVSIHFVSKHGKVLLLPNIAAQARRVQDAQYETAAPPRRCLKPPGWAAVLSFEKSHQKNANTYDKEYKPPNVHWNPEEGVPFQENNLLPGLFINNDPCWPLVKIGP